MSGSARGRCPHDSVAAASSRRHGTRLGQDDVHPSPSPVHPTNPWRWPHRIRRPASSRHPHPQPPAKPLGDAPAHGALGYVLHPRTLTDSVLPSSTAPCVAPDSAAARASPIPCHRLRHRSGDVSTTSPAPKSSFGKLHPATSVTASASERPIIAALALPRLRDHEQLACRAGELLPPLFHARLTAVRESQLVDQRPQRNDFALSSVRPCQPPARASPPGASKARSMMPGSCAGRASQ